jgi:hypothetical protein
LTLAFTSEEFYTLQEIELRPIPSQEIQQIRFSQFRQRVSNVLQEAFREQRPITTTEAEQIVWAGLETELLDLPVSYHG